MAQRRYIITISVYYCLIIITSKDKNDSVYASLNTYFKIEYDG